MSGLAIQWLILFVDVSVKSILVAAVAGLGLTLLRVRDSNLRHRVWTGVLCGMLLLPVLTQIVPALRLPFAIDPEWFTALSRVDISETQVAEMEPEGPDESPSNVESNEEPNRGVVNEATSNPFGNSASGSLDRFDSRPDWPQGSPDGRPYYPGEMNRVPVELPPQVEGMATVATQVETQLIQANRVAGKTDPKTLRPTFGQILVAHPPLAILCVWLAGVFLFALRLLAGLRVASRLKRAAQPIDPQELPANRNGIPILTCPLIRVPLTLGVICPRILLPEDWIDWSVEKLDAVLVHERTHAERGDCVLTLLTELNRCVYWFHPLAWWLRSRLASLAETACDDAAIGLTGDRAGYARHLLEVAATARAHRGRLVSGSVSMARCSNVESRINAILDFTRPLSQRLTRATGLVLVAIIVPLIGFAAALRPLTSDEKDPNPVAAATSSEKGTPVVEQSVTDDARQDPSDPADQPATKLENATAQRAASEDSFTFAGTVVDPNGKPVAGAKVYLGIPALERQPVAITAADGTFRFSKKRTVLVAIEENGVGSEMALIATGDGFGFASGFAPYFETTGQLPALLMTGQINDESGEAMGWMEKLNQTLARVGTDWRTALEPIYGPASSVLKLASDVPVRMKVVNVDGQPVAGVKVDLLGVWLPKKPTLDMWEKEPVEPHWSFNEDQGFDLEIAGAKAAVLTTVTDVDPAGWRELGGLGRERIAKIQITGRGVEAAIVHVRTRPGEIIRIARSKKGSYGYEPYYPSEFIHVAGPSQPVTGRVTDSRTGAPISGCVVRGPVHHTSDGYSFMNLGFVTALTDSNGNYRLDGITPARERTIGDSALLQQVSVLPPRGTPYLPTERSLLVGTKSEPLAANVPLDSGVRVRGTVLNDLSGRPISARVSYSPFREKSKAKSDEIYSDETLYQTLVGDDYYNTDGEGRFEIPVPAGRGVLVVTAVNSFAYPSLSGRESLKAALTAAGAACSYPKDASLVMPLLLAKGTDVATVNLRLGKGHPLDVNVVTGTGEPRSSYLIYQGPQFPNWKKAYDDPFKVRVHFPAKQRRLLFYDPGTNLVGHYDIDRRVPKKVKITLSSGGVVKGRIVDKSGRPLQGIEVVDVNMPGAIPNSDPLNSDPTRGAIPTALDKASTLRTTADGRFEVRGIIPGLKYTAVAFGHEDGVPIRLGTLFTNLMAEQGEVNDLGDVVPDPTIPQVSDVKQRPVGSLLAQSEPVPSVRKAKNDVAFTYSGTVVDPDDKPVAGAKLFFGEFTRESNPDLRPLAITAADGTFRFSRRKRDLEKPGQSRFSLSPPLVATAEGFGFALGDSILFETSGRLEEWLVAKDPEEGKIIAAQRAKSAPVLKLVRDDVPVRMKVMTIEGRPIDRVNLTLLSVDQPGDANRESWEQDLKKPDAVAEVYDRTLDSMINGPRSAVVMNVSAPNQDGWIQIKGLGRDRIAKVQLTGRGIESAIFYVRTRSGETVRLPRDSGRRYGNEIYYAAEFTHVAGPSQPIEGMITDSKTGNPVPECAIQSPLTRSTDGFHFFQFGHVIAQTDAAGYYRLEGLPAGKHSITVLPPRGSASLPAGFRQETGTKPEPVHRDFVLSAGVRIQGTVTDVRTGLPVEAALKYSPFSSNPSLAKVVGFQLATLDHYYYHSDVMGRFEIPVLPGKGFLALQAYDYQTYPFTVGAEAVKEAAAADGVKVEFSNYANLLTLVDLGDDAETATVNMTLDSGRRIKGTVESPDGKAVENYLIFGASQTARWSEHQGQEFEIQAWPPTENRQLMFYDPQRNLVAVRRLTVEPPERLKIVLRPGAVIKGRIVDMAGVPIEGAEITRANAIMPSPMETKSSVDPMEGVVAHDLDKVSRLRTGSDGRFEIRGVIPGLKYSATVIGEPEGQHVFLGRIFSNVTVESGEVKDLGDVVPDTAKLNVAPGLEAGRETNRAPISPGGAAKPIEKMAVQTVPTNGGILDSKAVVTPDTGSTKRVIRGRVVGPDGKAAANAKIAVIGRRLDVERGGDLNSRSEVLIESTSGEDGRFEIALTGVSSKTHVSVNVVARADDCGMTWERIDPDALDTELSCAPKSEQVIQGRLIDIEGKPAAGVALSVVSVVENVSAEKTKHGVGYHHFPKPPQAWPPGIISDERGRFTIRGIPQQHGVHLQVVGSDRFAPQELSINTGMSEERPSNDATYRSLVRNFKPNQEAVLPLAPAQMFEGVIRYADTNEPAPNARLTIWASQQALHGSMLLLAGQADAQGRYRINPPSGVRFGINAYPPEGVPYLIREKRELTHHDAPKAKRVDIELPRGVLVRGRVIESGTKAPVVGATIQYVPQRATEARTPDVITGWQAIQLSNSDGEFEIAVMHGPGTLLVSGQRRNYVIQEIGSQQLSDGLPGGMRNYAHAIKAINPEPDANPLQIELELKRGTAVSGKITNTNGEPIQEALLITKLNLPPLDLRWRASPMDVMGGRFELSGLANGVEHPAHFLDAKNRLGATAMLTSEDTSPSVVLVPCGSATATFVDKQGKPVVNHRPTLEFVMTPGAVKFDLKSMRAGLLSADSDFVANVDRTNYWNGPQTDAEGRILFPVLIPGARYRLYRLESDGPLVLKEFVAESGKTLDLGQITIKPLEEESP